MIPISVYRIDSGEIVRSGEVSTLPQAEAQVLDPEGNADPNKGWIEETADPQTQYVVDGVLTDRPAHDPLPAPGAAPATVTIPWPDGTTYSVINEAGDASTFTKTAEDNSLTFEDPGTYSIRAGAFPYLSFAQDVEVPSA